MADDDNVVFLAFSNPNLKAEQTVWSACAHCRNKTFTIEHDAADFPLMKCATCGNHIGRIGWAGDPE